jgi:hypothetical protein
MKNLVMATLQKIKKNIMDFQAILINFNKKSYKIQDYAISTVLQLTVLTCSTSY